MKGFESKDNKMLKQIIVKKEDMKKILLDLKSAYKYKNKFIEENYNVSFGILILENFLVIVEYVLKNFNINMGFATSLKYNDKTEEYILNFEFDRFYDVDLKAKTKDEIDEFLKELSEVEKDILEDFLDKAPTIENILEKISTFCNNTNNMDESIKAYKEENAEMKKSMLDYRIMKGLFDVFALNVMKDTVTKEYLLGE